MVCQGFVYDHQQNVAFFKGQTNGSVLDSKGLCSNPTAYAWLRNTGQWTSAVYSMKIRDSPVER